MRSFSRRRLRNSALTLVGLALVWAWVHRLEGRLQSSNYFTGWLLLGAVGFLALFQLRKKLPAPPLGTAAGWMQAHIYVGLATAGLFMLHAPLRLPNGQLETALAGLYAASFASGLIGLYWTRTLPRRLTRVGDEVTYERIAAARGGIRDRAEAAILRGVRSAGAATLGQFYDARLHPYFSSRRNWRYRLIPTGKMRKSLMADLTDIARYLSEAERKVSEELFSLVRERDDLDYHEALTWRLRVWLFVHIALTYPLLAAAGLHAWLAYAFRGGSA